LQENQRKRRRMGTTGPGTCHDPESSSPIQHSFSVASVFSCNRILSRVQIIAPRIGAGHISALFVGGSTLHPLFEKASRLTEKTIGGAIEVHRDKGPGLIESIYEWCLLIELGLRDLQCVSQKVVLVEYKEATKEEPLRFDVLVEGCVL